MSLYLIIKSLHVVCDMIWMAGMLRLTDTNGDREATLEFDQHFTAPAMLGAWTAGIWLTLQVNWWAHPWWKVKVGLALGMSALHGILTARLRKERKHWAAASVLVPVLMIAIVMLAVGKPG